MDQVHVMVVAFFVFFKILVEQQQKKTLSQGKGLQILTS